MILDLLKVPLSIPKSTQNNQFNENDPLEARVTLPCRYA